MFRIANLFLSSFHETAICHIRGKTAQTNMPLSNCLTIGRSYERKCSHIAAKKCRYPRGRVCPLTPPPPQKKNIYIYIYIFRTMWPSPNPNCISYMKYAFQLRFHSYSIIYFVISLMRLLFFLLYLLYNYSF